MFDFNKPQITKIFNEILSKRDAEFPEYTTRDKRDFGVMLMWIMAVVVKFLADWVNRLFRNLFFTTSTDRAMLIDEAVGRGYRPRGVVSSKQLLIFTVTQAMTIPAGFQVKTKNDVIFETESDLVFSGAGTGKVYATQGQSHTEPFVSDGTPNQRFFLSNTPFVEGSISVSVELEGEYKAVRDIVDADLNENVFMYYSDELGRGVLEFGTGSNGKIPANGSTITVEYMIGDGELGNVEDGTITELVNSLAGVDSVTNVRVANTQVEAKFVVGDTALHVESTKGFTDSGTAYVGDIAFFYTAKTATSFTGVSGINYDIPIDVTVSSDTQGLVKGADLETIDDIRYNGIMMSRTHGKIVSEEDYESFVLSHPAIAWSRAYTIGDIVHVVALTVSGEAMPSALKSELQTMINDRNISLTKYLLHDPEFVNVDVVIQVEKSADAVFDSAETVSTDPVIYKGVKQNVEKAIEDYFSPIASAQRITQGKNREYTLYGMYSALDNIPLSYVKNAKILNFTTREPLAGTVGVLAGSTTLTGVNTEFTELDTGDLIKLYGSNSGNNLFVKIIGITSDTEMEIKFLNQSDLFQIDEAGLKFYQADVTDIPMNGNQIPKVATSLAIDAQNPMLNESSGRVISQPAKELNVRLSSEVR